MLAAVVQVGCTTSPPRGGALPAEAVSRGALPEGARDDPDTPPPGDPLRVPDAEPKLEAIRSGGPNKPYDVLGKSYVPITQDAMYSEQGVASWYGPRFHGKRTASGEVYNMYAMTAAHPTLPIPSYARVRNPANGREVVVRVNDRGPFHAGRIVDLSYTAAAKLDLLRGVGPVELQRITFDDIRTGAWRRDGDAAPAARFAGSVGAAAPVVASAPVTRASMPASAAPASLAPMALARPAGPAAPTAPVAIAEPLAVLATTPVAPEPAPPLPAGPASPPERVADAPLGRAYTVPARGFWVQLGAFRARDGAESFHQRVVVEMDWISPLLAVFVDAAVFRLQAGPYPSRDEARGVAERVRDGLKLVPMIVERR